MPAKKGVLRPDLRKYNTEFERARHIPFLRARAQANFREEGWTLTFEQFCNIWTDEFWARRGKAVNSLVMTRLRKERPWSATNVKLSIRGTHLKKEIDNRRNQMLVARHIKKMKGLEN